MLHKNFKHVFDAYTRTEYEVLRDYKRDVKAGKLGVKKPDVEKLKLSIAMHFKEDEWSDNYIVCKVILKALSKIAEYRPTPRYGSWRIELFQDQPATYQTPALEQQRLSTLALPAIYQQEADYVLGLDLDAKREIMRLIVLDDLLEDGWCKFEVSAGRSSFIWGIDTNEHMFIAYTSR